MSNEPCRHARPREWCYECLGEQVVVLTRERDDSRASLLREGAEIDRMRTKVYDMHTRVMAAEAEVERLRAEYNRAMEMIGRWVMATGMTLEDAERAHAVMLWRKH